MGSQNSRIAEKSQSAVVMINLIMSTGTRTRNFQRCWHAPRLNRQPLWPQGRRILWGWVRLANQVLEVFATEEGDSEPGVSIVVAAHFD
jgi:hypothetical protein